MSDMAALHGAQGALSSSASGVPCDNCFIPVASADDPQGLKAAAAAARCAGLTTKDEKRRFHDAITGQGITDFQELVAIAKECKGGV